MLYDIDADKVIIVAVGEKVGAGSVESVEENLLRLRGADGVRTLTLKADGSTK
jgi:hypothetical protein